MKTIGIICELNPMHNGHKYLIDECKKNLSADRVILVMSGDYVQRGAPAIIDKFTRAKTAILSGGDVVIELPVYYSLGSAEYFAMGAVSLLNSLGVVDYLCFGSETEDIKVLEKIADILVKEPGIYKDVLKENQKKGLSFASARQEAVIAQISSESDNNLSLITQILSSPNSILALEYIKALKKLKSGIKPVAIKRVGAPHDSELKFDEDDHVSTDFHGLSVGLSSSGIRARLLSGSGDHVRKNAMALLSGTMPQSAIDDIASFSGHFMTSDRFSSYLLYKLLSESDRGFTDYLDVNRDISNSIVRSLYSFEDISSFCNQLKSKNIAYSRISRSLFHILLNIYEDNMQEYKEDEYTNYARILALKSSSSDIVGLMNEKSTIPVISRLKDADLTFSLLQKRLLDESLSAGRIYSSICYGKVISEYSLKPIIL